MQNLLQYLVQQALERALTKLLDQTVARAVSRAKAGQERVSALLSGYSAGLHMTYSGGFLIGALLFCVILSAVFGEIEGAVVFGGAIVVMLALIL